MDGEVVGDGLAGVVAVEAVQLLEVGDGDLGHVLRDLDLGGDGPVGGLHRRQLVHAAEHRLAAGGDEPLAHAEGVDLRPLEQQVPDQLLVQGVGGGDGAALPPGGVQHLPGLLGEIGDVAGVQADAALGDAHGAQHLVEGPDSVGHAAFQRVVGIHQQHGVGGVDLAVGLEGLVLGGEHLHPGVGHGTHGGYAVDLVGDGAGGPRHTADVGGSGPHHGGVHPLGPAGAELHDRPALRGPDHPVGLGSDEALVVDAQQSKGLDELGLRGGGPDGDQRLAGEHRRPLRHGPHVAGKAKAPQVIQEVLLEEVFAPQVGDVVLVKMEVPDILHELLQPRGDGEAAAVGHLAEKHVEIGDLILHPLAEVPVGHGHLIEVKEHGQVQLFLMFHHGRSSILCYKVVRPGGRRRRPLSGRLYSISFFLLLQR